MNAKIVISSLAIASFLFIAVYLLNPAYFVGQPLGYWLGNFIGYCIFVLPAVWAASKVWQKIKAQPTKYN